MKEHISAFLRKAVSPYHAVEACKEVLEAAGFKELLLKNPKRKMKITNHLSV